MKPTSVTSTSQGYENSDNLRFAEGSRGNSGGTACHVYRELQEYSFPDHHPCWGGLLGDVTAFKSPTLL